MQVSEKSRFDLEALEELLGEETGAIALDPVQHAPGRKLRKVKSVPHLIFALCASICFMPFTRLLRQPGGDKGSFLDGAARIVLGEVFKSNIHRNLQNLAIPPTIAGAKN